MKQNVRTLKRRSTWNAIKRDWRLYVFLIIPVVYTIIFKYLPMGGLVIAFEDPDTKIIILSPVWRVNIDAVKPFGDFLYLAKWFAHIASEIDHVAVIDCINYIPHTQECFSDHVHPNDLGFEAYAQGLSSALKEMELL